MPATNIRLQEAVTTAMTVSITDTASSSAKMPSSVGCQKESTGRPQMSRPTTLTHRKTDSVTPMRTKRVGSASGASSGSRSRSSMAPSSAGRRPSHERGWNASEEARPSGAPRAVLHRD